MENSDSQTESYVASLLNDMVTCWESSRTGNDRRGCKIPLFRQPERLAYCIGPNYHNPYYRQMEQEKKVMLYAILIQVNDQRKDAVLNSLLEKVNALENKARGHYLEQPCQNMSHLEFVQMLLLDGCYILGKFVLPDYFPSLLAVRPANGAGNPPRGSHGVRAAAGNHRGEATSSSHSGDMAESQISENPAGMTRMVGTAASHSGSGSGNQSAVTSASQGGNAMQNMELVRDVFYRLDNQIPFFVLDTIYDVLCSFSSTPGVMKSGIVAQTLIVQVQALLKHFGYSIRDQLYETETWHLHHMLYKHFVQAMPEPDGTNVSTNNDVRLQVNTATLYRWRAATFYHATGVIFRKRHLRHGASKTWCRWVVDGGARSILDVKFDPLTLRLRIPSLMVDKNTSTILRNLMMLEQHNPGLGSQVTAYCYFLSQLAGTASDVALLAKKGIIVHLLPSDDDVAKMLGELCKGIIMNPADERNHNYLHDTRKGLERMYKNRPIRWLALLYHRHLSNPFVAILMLAAIVGFVSELLQAIYAVKSYKCHT